MFYVVGLVWPPHKTSSNIVVQNVLRCLLVWTGLDTFLKFWSCLLPLRINVRTFKSEIIFYFNVTQSTFSAEVSGSFWPQILKFCLLLGKRNVVELPQIIAPQTDTSLTSQDDAFICHIPLICCCCLLLLLLLLFCIQGEKTPGQPLAVRMCLVEGTDVARALLAKGLAQVPLSVSHGRAPIRTTPKKHKKAPNVSPATKYECKYHLWFFEQYFLVLWALDRFNDACQLVWQTCLVAGWPLSLREEGALVIKIEQRGSSLSALHSQKAIERLHGLLFSIHMSNIRLCHDARLILLSYWRWVTLASGTTSHAGM